MKKLLSAFLLLIASIIFSDGMIIPDVYWHRPPDVPTYPIRLVEHEVRMEIKGDILVAEIKEVFENPTDYTVEGVYVFPTPKGALIKDFRMIVDGRVYEGKILSKDEARRRYIEYVSKLRDPALLEYIGFEMIQLKIAPLRPGERRTIEIKYSQVLGRRENTLKLLYPLKINSVGKNRIGRIHIRGVIHGDVLDVYSPFYELRVDRKADETVFDFKDENMVAEKDFIVYITMGEKWAGFGFETYKPFPDEPGYFMLTIAPRLTLSEALNKHVVFVLDKSGSMEGTKLNQAKEALKYIAENLGEGDLLTVVVFDSLIKILGKPFMTKKDLPTLLESLERVVADGSTNIGSALRKALYLCSKSPLKVNYIIFLTDGLPTVGLERDEIIDMVRKLNRTKEGLLANIFVFGVGEDVDPVLLDTLAEENGGISKYVIREATLEEAISTLYRTISSPVLTDVKISFEGVEVEKVVPFKITGIFAGVPVRIFGKYITGGIGRIKIEGKKENTGVTYEYSFKFPKQDDDDDYVEYVWARRYMAYLERRILIYGPNEELKREIERLSKKYGIPSILTSLLIEEQPIQYRGVGAPPSAPAPTSVKAAKKISESLEVERITEKTMDRKFLAGKTFVLKDDFWVDTEFEENEVIKVLYMSKAYFKLMELFPEFLKYLSLGKNIKIRIDGYNLVIDENEGISSEEELLEKLGM